MEAATRSSRSRGTGPPYLQGQAQPEAVADKTREDVEMNVQHLLACRFAVSEIQVDAVSFEPGRSKRRGKLLRHDKQVSTG